MQGLSHSEESTAVTWMPGRWGEVLVNVIETQSGSGISGEDASKEPKAHCVGAPDSQNAYSAAPVPVTARVSAARRQGFL